ncbi:MAG: hypothetical protein F9K22_06355 [Bacteroidetes bacterium]|nr:MAG: hypothetical protein F9K22_06355 [Bacteroidota bacterium]
MNRLLILLVLCSVPVSAQYRSAAALASAVKDLASSRSTVVSLTSLAKTQQGNDLWLLTVGKRPERKAVLVVGGVDAVDLAGTEYAVRTAQRLAAGYGTVDSITALLNDVTFYIIPRLNPDAAQAFFASPLSERSTTVTPFDDDGDGAVDEDGPEDINKDGMVTMMRVRDERGEWLPDPDEPRVMRKADAAKGERGMYRLYSEGVDNDKDEEWNEDPAGGTDLNRNFTYAYQYFGKNSGINQMSEAESRAVADFLFDHQNIAVVFSFAPNDNLTAPWKHEPPRGESPHVTSVMKDDEEYMAAVGKLFSETTLLKDAPKSAKGEGAFSEWAYFHAGRWSFSVRSWWPAEPPKDTSVRADSLRKKTEGKKGEKSDDPSVRALRWFDAAGVKEVALPWKKAEHPDFPDRDVEVGGVRPYALQNPPADSLDRFSLPYSTFIMRLGSRLPSLRIVNEKVERLGRDLYRVSADILNDGFLPTLSAMGVRSRWLRSVLIDLETGSGVRIVSGRQRQPVGPLKGNGGFATVSWIVSGSGAVGITAECPSAGTAAVSVKLRTSK